MRRCTQSSKPSALRCTAQCGAATVCVDFAVGGDACARHRALGRRHTSLRRTRSMGRAERGRRAKPLPVAELLAANAVVPTACERIREHTRVHSHALALAHGCAGVLRYARSAACAVAHDVLGVPSHAALCWAVRPAPRRGGAVRVRHASVGRDCQAFTFARHARFEAAGAAAAYRRYEVRACATVDASWASPATQRSPEMPAQTHLANARTNPEWRKEGSPPQSASSLGHTYLAPLPSCLATSLHPPLTSTLCTIPAPCA
jgi:hypothetical protein